MIVLLGTVDTTLTLRVRGSLPPKTGGSYRFRLKSSDRMTHGEILDIRKVLLLEMRHVVQVNIEPLMSDLLVLNLLLDLQLLLQ